jgi:hypothetical protein
VKNKPWLKFYRPFDPTGAASADGKINPLSLRGPRISAGAEGNQNLPHFRIPEELVAVLPENPEEIDIVPIMPDHLLNAWFARYDASNSLQCRGNGDDVTPGLEKDRKTGDWKPTASPCGQGCPSYDLYLAQRGQNAAGRQKVKADFERDHKRPIPICTGLEVRLLFLVVGLDGKLYGPCDLRSHSIYFLNDAAAQVQTLLHMEEVGHVDLWRSVLTIHKQKQRVGISGGPSRENYTVGLKVKTLHVPGFAPLPKVEEKEEAPPEFVMPPMALKRKEQLPSVPVVFPDVNEIETAALNGWINNLKEVVGPEDFSSLRKSSGLLQKTGATMTEDEKRCFYMVLKDKANEF